MATATVEDVGPCKRLLRVVVPTEEVQNKLDEHYEQLRESVAISGFRKGRAPRALLEKRFGEQVAEEVQEALMAEAGQEALDENGLAMIGEPSYDNVEFAEGSEFTFELTVEVKPEFELPDYKGLKLVRQKAEVSEEDIEKRIEEIRLSRGTFEPVSEGGFQKEDVVEADWSVECDGEQVASETKAFLNPQAGSVGNVQIEDLPGKLEGAAVGEEREAPADFPEDHPVEHLRGKKGVAKIKLASIFRPRLPEVDDEFAKALDFDSVDELKDAVRDDLQRRAEREAREALETDAVTQMLDAVSIEIPEGVVKRQAREMLKQQELRMRYYGFSEEEIQERLSNLQSMSEDSVRRGMRTFFLFEKIAENEKIFVTEDEVESRIERLAIAYQKTPQQMAKQLEDEGGVGQLRRQMRDEKVLEMILSNAEIQDAQ